MARAEPDLDEYPPQPLVRKTDHQGGAEAAAVDVIVDMPGVDYDSMLSEEGSVAAGVGSDLKQETAETAKTGAKAKKEKALCLKRPS